jgi:hypothetical protein
LLEILIIVAQKRKKSCLKIAHFPQKVATLQESCSKVATLGTVQYLLKGRASGKQGRARTFSVALKAGLLLF